MMNINPVTRRSREGAWIEMSCVAAAAAWRKRRSREGAWIEIAKKYDAETYGISSLPRGSVD